MLQPIFNSSFRATVEKCRKIIKSI